MRAPKATVCLHDESLGADNFFSPSSQPRTCSSAILLDGKWCHHLLDYSKRTNWSGLLPLRHAYWINLQDVAKLPSKYLQVRALISITTATTLELKSGLAFIKRFIFLGHNINSLFVSTVLILTATLWDTWDYCPDFGDEEMRHINIR